MFARRRPRLSGVIEAHADGADEEAAPWTSLTPNDADDLFHFVIVSDRTGGERRGVFPAAMPKINLLEPAFVISVGDLIAGYTEDQARLDHEWDEFERFIDELETPFFYAVGNHDMSNAVMAETWQRRFGPVLLQIRVQGRVVPGPQFRTVRNGERPGIRRAGAVDASRAT